MITPTTEHVYDMGHFEVKFNFVTCAQCGNVHRVTDYTYAKICSNTYKGKDAIVEKIWSQHTGVVYPESYSYVLCNTGTCLTDHFGDASIEPPILKFDVESPNGITTGTSSPVDIVASATIPGTFSSANEASGNTNGSWGFDANFDVNGQFNFSGFDTEGTAYIEIIFSPSDESLGDYSRIYTIKVD